MLVSRVIYAAPELRTPEYRTSRQCVKTPLALWGVVYGRLVGVLLEIILSLPWLFPHLDTTFHIYVGRQQIRAMMHLYQFLPQEPLPMTVTPQEQVDMSLWRGFLRCQVLLVLVEEINVVIRRHRP
jgi:hypothetical protein